MNDRARAEGWLRRLPLGSPLGVALVVILDAIDAETDELEDEGEAEPEPLEMWETGSEGAIIEHCPCCGGETGREWIGP